MLKYTTEISYNEPNETVALIRDVGISFITAITAQFRFRTEFWTSRSVTVDETFSQLFPAASNFSNQFSVPMFLISSWQTLITVDQKLVSCPCCRRSSRFSLYGSNCTFCSYKIGLLVYRKPPVEAALVVTYLQFPIQVCFPCSTSPSPTLPLSLTLVV